MLCRIIILQTRSADVIFKINTFFNKIYFNLINESGLNINNVFIILLIIFEQLHECLFP